MINKLSVRLLLGIIALLGLSIFTSCYAGQLDSILAKTTGVTIYTGKTTKSNITTGTWGSGDCFENSQATYNGGKTLQVDSDDLYSGGRIDFKTPVDVTTSFSDPTTYLQLTARFDQPATPSTVTTPGGTPGVAPPGGVRPGAATPVAGLQQPVNIDDKEDRRRQVTQPTARPGVPGVQNPRAPITGLPTRIQRRGPAIPTRNLRVVIVLDNNESLEYKADLSEFKKTSDGWSYISLPVSLFKGNLSLSQYKIKRMIFAGDGSNPFYIAEIVTTRDLIPLQAITDKSKEVAKYDMVTFQGTSVSGTTAVKYSWDFDDSDGIQVDATGPVVAHQFTKSGTFTVTLTVSDPFGIKRSAMAKTKVKVNQ